MLLKTLLSTTIIISGQNMLFGKFAIDAILLQNIDGSKLIC